MIKKHIDKFNKANKGGIFNFYAYLFSIYLTIFNLIDGSYIMVILSLSAGFINYYSWKISHKLIIKERKSIEKQIEKPKGQWD